MSINLIVKGTKQEAAQAASDRSIPFTFIRETTRGETIGKTNVSFYLVANWFSEDARAPYPAGTLLHFSACGE